MSKLIKSLKKSESGAALIEYAVICGLVLAVAAATFTAIGTNLNTIFTSVMNYVIAAAAK